VETTDPRCTECRRDFEAIGGEKYRCPECGATWLRIGGLYERVENLPQARIVTRDDE
jgi:tRNA(Ile2) C34 agmatinyltransferase TiaS